MLEIHKELSNHMKTVILLECKYPSACSLYTVFVSRFFESFVQQCVASRLRPGANRVSRLHLLCTKRRGLRAICIKRFGERIQLPMFQHHGVLRICKTVSA